MMLITLKYDVDLYKYNELAKHKITRFHLKAGKHEFKRIDNPCGPAGSWLALPEEKIPTGLAEGSWKNMERQKQVTIEE